VRRKNTKEMKKTRYHNVNLITDRKS
jgi:hypothetical protein